MEPTIVAHGPLTLVGFSFFGDPFRLHGGWTEENEIGRLWARFRTYCERHPDGIPTARNDAAYEVHLTHDDTERTGEYEVFVGVAVEDLAVAPVETVVKILPAATYAVFTLTGDEIGTDWPRAIGAWMAQAGYDRAYPYGFQYYDARFKGLEHMAESVLDVYVPIRPVSSGRIGGPPETAPC